MLPLPRRMLCDLLDLAAARPSATVTRPFPLRSLTLARDLAVPRPGWRALFVKWFAQVMTATPELRVRMVTFPWRRLIHSTRTVVSTAVERLILDGSCVLFGPVQDAHSRPIVELDDLLRSWKDCDPGSVAAFRHQLRLGRLPGLIRRGWLSAALSRLLGCGVVVGLADAELTPPSLPVPVLSYGPVSSGGEVEVSLRFDPRAIAPTTAARSLVDLERLMRTDAVAELRYLEGVEAA
jgi:hypothetical protein